MGYGRSGLGTCSSSSYARLGWIRLCEARPAKKGNKTKANEQTSLGHTRSSINQLIIDRDSPSTAPILISGKRRKGKRRENKIVEGGEQLDKQRSYSTSDIVL